MHALDLLTADHNRVRGLFARFQSAQDADDRDAMSSLATEILTELEVHTTIEEEIFYPAAKGTSDEIDDLIAEGVQEHHVVKLLMAELKQTPDVTEEWVAKMTVLIENVEHHADEEEADMFPPLRSKLGTGELKELAERLEARKAELGAPVLEDKIDLTKDELLDLAREQAIPGRSSMSQEELAATVAPPSR